MQKKTISITGNSNMDYVSRIIKIPVQYFKEAIKLQREVWQGLNSSITQLLNYFLTRVVCALFGSYIFFVEGGIGIMKVTSNPSIF